MALPFTIVIPTYNGAALTAACAVAIAGLAFRPTRELAALTGVVSSEAEGNMEGVVVTAHKPGSIIQVSVTTDAQGRYTFPENRLEPGEYNLEIRAVGYDIGAPAKATVESEKTATNDIKPNNPRHEMPTASAAKKPANFPTRSSLLNFRA